MKFSALLFGTALALGACVAHQPSPSDPQSSSVKPLPVATLMAKTPVLSSGMVAAANPHATEAGLEVLRAGGSAVDAAIAVQAVLGLVEPQSSGLGGGAFMVVYDSHTGEVWSYDGRETAPAAATPELFIGEDGKPIRRFPAAIASGLSTGVPGAVVMLHRAHEDYGQLNWGPQFEPALRLAEDGFAISPRMANLMARIGPYAMKNHPVARAYFFEADGETTHPEGFVRDNPAYADTLKALQANPRALLEGPVAETIIATVQEAPLPGTLSLADMAAYEPKKKTALCVPYRVYTICGARPPASGGVAVASILGILENFDMAALGATPEGWHHFAEASFLAYADRDKYVADPAFVKVPVEAMLDRDYLASRAARISSDTAMKNVTAGDLGPAGEDATPDNPGTSHFTVMDGDGLVVSMTTTVEAPFGSQRMAAGFMLNNQLTDFSFTTHDADGQPIANAPAPGKRPRSSMSPTIVFGPDGEFLFSTGSPGGNSIIAYTAKTIVGILDWGLTPQDAIELPNVIARGDTLRVEAARIDEALVPALEAKGHTVVQSKGEISGLHIIYRNADGSLTGAADPRREGTAQAVE